MKRQGRGIPEHKKHSAFPGLELNSDQVKIESGSIRPLRKIQQQTPIVVSKSKHTGPDWERYDAAIATIRDTGKNASSAALAIRNSFEFKYYLACRPLVKAGKLPQIRRKYRLR